MAKSIVAFSPCGLRPDALLLGPVQFWPGLRRNHLPTHRVLGRIYVLSILVGAIAAAGLAATITNHPAWAIGLCALALAWLTTTGMACVAIRRKVVLQHKQWMVRSYVVTFAFVTYRLVTDFVKMGHHIPDRERQALIICLCWAIPLLFTEVVLQSSAVFKPRLAN